MGIGYIHVILSDKTSPVRPLGTDEHYAMHQFFPQKYPVIRPITTPLISNPAPHSFFWPQLLLAAALAVLPVTVEDPVEPAAELPEFPLLPVAVPPLFPVVVAVPPDPPPLKFAAEIV